MSLGGVSTGPSWMEAASSNRPRRRFRWSNLLWLLVYPRGGQRILPTVSGTALIVMAFGIGSAAYNTSNNILFITLSLLLSCLIVSGILSWLNFRGVRWRVQLAAPFRAGQAASVLVDLANAKRLLPTYGLWFDFSAVPVPTSEAARRAARGAKDGRTIRQLMAEAGKGRLSGRLFLRDRLSPEAEERLEWNFTPERRGLHRFSLEGVGSLFPFGFLRKELSSGMRHEILVWPAPIDYEARGLASSRTRSSGQHSPRPGQGSDLLALRRYAPGDSHRLIHWKASARVRQLVVRQYAAESRDQLWLWVKTASDLWPRPEQFERMLSLAATLAEDLFREGKLAGVALDHAPARPVNRVHELEAFLDELAEVQRDAAPVPAPGEESHSGPTGRHLLTFVPDGPNGVAAFADGIRTATA